MTHEGSHQLLLGSAASDPSGPGRGGAVAGFAPGRTLGVRVEVARQLRRRRTQYAYGFLVLLPVLVALAYKVGDDDGTGNGLVDLATRGAANFTLFTLLVSTGFLLVVVVALFAGDTVASEASWSSLRYLLASPVPRGRLLTQKLVVALLFCAAAVFLLTVVAYVVGGLFFGWAAAQTPLGDAFSFGTSVQRLLIVVGYLMVTLLFVAALAFCIGVFTDAPLGAVGGAVMLVVVSNILDAVTALGSLRSALPTHYSVSWTDALGSPISWDQMSRGALWSVGYTIPLLALAWWHFLRKDIVS